MGSIWDALYDWFWDVDSCGQGPDRWGEQCGPYYGGRKQPWYPHGW